MSTDFIVPITASQLAKEVSKPGKSGPKPKGERKRQAELILRDSSPEAARFIADCNKGNIKKPNRERLQSCRYTLDHILGSPKQKQEDFRDRGAPIKITNVIVMRQEEIKTGIDMPKIEVIEGAIQEQGEAKRISQEGSKEA